MSDSFEVTGWQSTGGVTLGFRFGIANARAYVAREAETVTVELDGAAHAFRISASFWRKCPEVRGAAITSWLRAHRLAPWPKGSPPRVELTVVGRNRFRADAPPRTKP